MYGRLFGDRTGEEALTTQWDALGGRWDELAVRLDVLAVRCEDASLLELALPNVPDCLAGRTGELAGTLFCPLPLCRLCSLLRPTRADIPAANWSKVRFLLTVDEPASLGAGTAGGTTTGAAFDFDVEFCSPDAERCSPELLSAADVLGVVAASFPVRFGGDGLQFSLSTTMPSGWLD